MGPDVTEWKVGDRVAIEAGVPCSQCEFCKIGRYNACPDVIFFSTPPYHVCYAVTGPGSTLRFLPALLMARLLICCSLASRELSPDTTFTLPDGCIDSLITSHLKKGLCLNHCLSPWRASTELDFGLVIHCSSGSSPIVPWLNSYPKC